MKKYLIIIITLLNVSSLQASETLRLVSYNILANQYIKQEYYPNANPKILEWNTRKDHLLKYILNIKADILLLQEFQEGQMRQFLEEELFKHGYKMVFIKKDSSAVGLATFYKKNKLSISHTSHITLETGSEIALLTKFTLPNKAILQLVNTKIKWVPKEMQLTKYLGYTQISDLLKTYPEFKDKTIICGDFNACQNSTIYQLFKEYNFTDSFENIPYNTINAHAKAERIDYCFMTRDIKYNSIKLSGLKDDTIVPSEEIPSDHLPLIIDLTF